MPIKSLNLFSLSPDGCNCSLKTTLKIDLYLFSKSFSCFFFTFLPEFTYIYFFFLFFNKVKVKMLSHVRLLATLWTVAHQAPLSMGFSRQEYLSGLPFPSPGDFPDLGIEPRSPALQADALTSESPGKPHIYLVCIY